MTGDKNQDPISKLYAEWISASVRLSVAGFDATAKLLEAGMQSVVAARAKAKSAESKSGTEVGGRPEVKASVTTVHANPEGLARQPEPAAAPQPAKAEKPVAAEKHKPEEPAKASTDDLKLISGIGPRLEQLLHKRGITGFAKLAAMKPADIAKLDEELGLNGRIQRDDWIGQAAKLAG